MPKTIKNNVLDAGLCVEVEAVLGGEGRIVREYGIILSHQRVQMEDDLHESLYTVLTPSGVDDYWAYEVMLVYPQETEYNTCIPTHRGK